MNRTALALVLPFVLVACSNPAEPGAAPAAPAAAAPVLRDVKALLNDRKMVAGYAGYQAAMAPHSRTAMEIFSSTSRSGGIKAMEEAAKKDPRILEYNKRNDAELAKAGLTQSDVNALSGALSQLVVHLGMARDSAGAKADNSVAQEIERSTLETLAKTKEEFVQKFGPAALDNVMQFAKELCAAQDAMMQAMLAK